MSLAALWLPGTGFAIGLLALSGRAGYPDLARAEALPLELGLIALFGGVATLAGTLDWRLHATGARLVGARERRAEQLALVAGGAPLFSLMVGASLSTAPSRWLIPILVSALFTTVCICYDERLFHRRCSRYETALHRVLVLGQAGAWLAWMHWCFARSGDFG